MSEDKELQPPYGERPVYKTPMLNSLIKRPEDSPATCKVCGVSLAGRIMQSTQYACDHCGRRFDMCRDCGVTEFCPNCGGWLLNSWELEGKWIEKKLHKPHHHHH